MNRPIEDLLRQAYQAKVEPITEQRLSQLSDARADAFAAELASDTLDTGGITRFDTGVLPVAARRPGHSRWFAPLLAAAAVVVVAAGAFAITTSHGQRNEQPAPPASHISLPAPSVSSTPSVSSKPSSSASTSSTGGTPADYLGRGRTGARSDVPWSVVGAGWRLFQTGYDQGSSIYLYDPADGRYLISDQISVRNLIAWSPDGARAMLQNPDGAGFTQLELHTGALTQLPVPRLASFVAYTKPRGLAVLVRVPSATGQPTLQRYGVDGSPQLTYSNKIDGIGVLNGPVFYVPDGSAFVTHGADRAFLIGNDGGPLQAYDPPAGTSSCRPVRLWDDASLLETCAVQNDSSRYALYLQPLDDSTPTKLIDRAAYSYSAAWALSNQDVLLQLNNDRCIGGYQILHPDGSISALRLPAGVSAPGNIANVSGDLATFWTTSSCGGLQSSPLLDYDMVTGKTLALGHGDMLNFPADN